MATKSRFKINAGPPKGWKPDVEISLKMYYFNNGPYYVFVYEIGSVAKSGKSVESLIGRDALIAGKVVPDGKGGRLFQGIPLQYLDIGLHKNDKHALITVQTIDKDKFTNLYWDQVLGTSDEIEAIMTEKDQTAFYGDLEYSNDGENWSKTKPSPCRYIRFKANVNKGDPDKHKFSYNVRLPDGVSNSAPLEIDPEIQNPKV